MITDPILFKREFEFMKDFGEARHDPDKFRKLTFRGFSALEFIKERPGLFTLIMCVGLVLGLPASLVLLFKLNPNVKVAVIIGTMANFTFDFFANIFFKASIYVLILNALSSS